MNPRKRRRYKKRRRLRQERAVVDWCEGKLNPTFADLVERDEVFEGTYAVSKKVLQGSQIFFGKPLYIGKFSGVDSATEQTQEVQSTSKA